MKHSANAPYDEKMKNASYDFYAFKQRCQLQSIFERKPSISLKNLSPVSVCTPPRQAVSIPRVVTIYPSAAAQIAMAGQAKWMDFQKN